MTIDHLQEVFREGWEAGAAFNGDFSDAASAAATADEAWEESAARTYAPAGSSAAWTAFSDAMPEPHRLLLVTNNLEARTAQGRMSHVWLVDMVHSHKRSVTFQGRVIAAAGEVTAFAGPGGRIRNLTHWRYALPEDVGTHEVK